MKLMQLRPRASAGRPISLRARVHVALGWAVVIGFLLHAAAASHAQNRFWITNTGGSFGTNANWSATAGGAGGATVPVAANTANFTTNSIYVVSFGGNATNAGLNAANGNITFDLGGFAYTITGNNGTGIGTTVGQTGRITLRNGTLGVDSADDIVTIGTTAASTGFLTLSTGGRLGNGTIRPDLVVGSAGTGNFGVEDNGRADVGYLVIGDLAGATGTATISGPNAVVTTESVVDVGVRGNATLNIQNSATMSTGLGVTFATLIGANGTATVTGIGSTWNQSSTATIGSAGDGSLTVSAGGLVSTAGAISLGSGGTGVGVAIVTGTDSKWNMASTLQIGGTGLGNFAVSAGGRANTSGGTIIAANAASHGNAVVTGAGSIWTSGAMTIGSAGAAAVSINSGGVVNSTGNVTFAGAATGTATATITGAGSAWNIVGGLNIASLGTGTLTVDTNATLSATGALTIGDPAGGQVGTLNFNGGTITAGSFTRASGAALNWTNGTILVNGGAFNNSGANLTINGSSLDDLPALRLSAGAQSLAANLPNLTIGSNHKGAVIVSGGSSFQTTTAALGSLDGGTGSLVVEGVNSSFSTTGDFGVGGTTAAGGGLGGITLGPGGTVTAGGTLRLWSGGTINIVGGTLRFNNLATNGGKAAFSSGTVQVLSNFNANAATLDALVGPTRFLGVGRKIETLANAFNLQSDLTVSGGAIAGNTLAVSANVLARFELGATGTFTNGITNPVGARIYVTDSSLGAGTTLTNSGELHLSGNTATVNGTGVTNSGLIEGSGRINSVITNNTAGQIRVAAGQRLEVLGAAGTTINNGLIDVNGGEIEFGRQVTNSSVNPSSGLIAARDATLRFQGNLANSGSLTFSAGISDVFGDVTNASNLANPGRIIVTGGAQANFFDDVVNNGVIQVSAAGTLQSTVVFLGSLSGTGVSGGGRVFIEGDARPGFSPGTMAFGGDVSFGPLSSLNIELAGATPGTQYDRVTVAETASIGGELQVSLLGGYRPAIGSSFEVFSAAGGVTGTFVTESLPELAGGANWDINYENDAVVLSVGGVLGDFNLDGLVDTADYTVWRNQLGSNSLAADASGNGTVDQSDFNIWKANFGDVAVSGSGSYGGPAAGAVPEPTSCVLMLVAGAFLASGSRSVRSKS